MPYKFNRGIIHDGNLPHLATPITSIHTSSEHPLVSQLRTSEIPQTPSGTGIDAATSSSTGIVSTSTGLQDVSTDTDAGVAVAVEGLRRVILGFNCFPHRVDECCRRATEHSGECIFIFKYYCLTISSTVLDAWNDSVRVCVCECVLE